MVPPCCLNKCYQFEGWNSFIPSPNQVTPRLKSSQLVHFPYINSKALDPSVSFLTCLAARVVSRVLTLIRKLSVLALASWSLVASWGSFKLGMTGAYCTADGQLSRLKSIQSKLKPTQRQSQRKSRHQEHEVT